MWGGLVKVSGTDLPSAHRTSAEDRQGFSGEKLLLLLTLLSWTLKCFIFKVLHMLKRVVIFSWSF